MTTRTEAIYISGPMTGLPELNFPAFAAATQELRGQGVNVINPAEHDEIPDMPWSFYLRKDIRLLMNCNAIHMLDGWTKSKGARLERHIAVEMGFAVTGAVA
jgi:hypothetical protein